MGVWGSACVSVYIAFRRICSFLTFKKDIAELKKVQKRGTKMTRGPQHKKQLQHLEPFSMGKGGAHD